MLLKLTLLALLPLLASAVPSPSKRDQLVLSSKLGADELAQLQGDVDMAGFSLDLDELRLVQFGEDEPPVWISEFDKIQAKADGKRFMDITDTPTLGFSSFLLPIAAQTKYSYPSPGNHSKAIKGMYDLLDIKHMKGFLTRFSGFRTRYYRSETGKESQRFLMGTIHSFTNGSSSDVSIHEFSHPWGQNSIIVRFEPASGKGGKDLKGKDTDAPITIVGAHQDSTNQWPFLPAPGADDDGSGTTSSLEALRALLQSNYTPSTGPVEFHYYSAEEGGLLGSQAIAKSYEDAGKKVKAMLQMDMTAWVKEGTTESVGIIQDFVDPDLTVFMEGLVEKYLDIPAVHTKCGYACSDHASFAKAGYQSAFAIESTFENSNHNIHSTQDTMNHPEFSFTHMREFSKLVVAFAIELGGIAKSN